jgi:predicted ribosomally synthesized peptide with SipW-like signal peptide
MELTRRKILASMGAVGAAGAAAGMGTSALFNDTESFTGNTLAAGELDLKVDWEEHYSYPQIYEGFEDPTVGPEGADLRVTRSEPEDTSGYVGLPDPEDPVVWVHEDDLGTYMSNTAIEAFPDPDNDGEQEVEYGGFSYDPCSDGGDLPEDLTPVEDDATRTANADTMGEEGHASLINLTDVKPGDFGELTFSFHLCDNPGYVWLQAANFSESGGANPEAEQATEGDDENDPNLAENIKTVWWYDDGDNVFDRRGNCDETVYLSDHGDGPVAELYEVEITGGDAEATSLAAIDDGETDFEASHIGASLDGETIYAVSEFQDKLATYRVSDGQLSIEEIDLNGRGPLGDVVQVAVGTDGSLYAGSKSEEAIFEISDPGGSPTVERRIDLSLDIAGADNVFTSNGQFYFYTNSTNALYTVNLISGETTQISSLETDEDLTGLAVRASGTGAFIGSISEGEEIIAFREDGSVEERFDLTGDLTEHTFGDLTTAELCEKPIGALGGMLDEDMTTLSNRVRLQPRQGDCFQPGFTRYIGFAWWVPEDVGNEIQGDSVSFDLGFYTEQCRNNDGELTSTPPT